jgi:Fungal specific transcription factor domain
MSSPTSPNNVAETLVSFSSSAVLNAESICRLPILELLIDDFFTYIHPLCPFPHEPSFRSAFNSREDLSNPQFLALTASMVGVLVASFPRRPRLHLKAARMENLFPNSISFVEKCHSIAIQARGAGYLDNPDLNVYDAITSYFLGLSGAYTFKWRQTRLYFGETLTMLRVIGVHKVKERARSGNDFDQPPQPEPVDYIKEQLGRRVFWVMFVGIRFVFSAQNLCLMLIFSRSMQQIGGSFGELLIPPPTKSEPYPPLPLEVDDEYIFEQVIEPQPAGTISKLTAFNLNCEIFETVTPLATMELAYGIDSVFDINKQKQVMEGCLRAVKRVLDNVPQELMLRPSLQPGEFAKTATPHYPPTTAAYPGLQADSQEAIAHGMNRLSEQRRMLQFEIQKANIYASQMGTRSYIVEKYWALETAYEELLASSGGRSNLSSPGVIAVGLDGMVPKHSPGKADGVEINIANERESVVKDLLLVLGSISQVNMEPNGASFVCGPFLSSQLC